jgi:outer membrane protein TolC
MSEMISALRGEEAEQVSTINAFLFRELGTRIVTESFPPVAFTEKTVEELIISAKQNRPYLLGVNEAIEKAKISQSLAEYDYYPMFKLSAQYGFRDKIESAGLPLDDMVSVMLDISIPLNYGGKVTAMVEETKSMQQMYEEQYSVSLQMLSREFGRIRAKMNSLKERIELVEQGSVIQARENLTSSLTAYQVGEIDFMNVLDAQNSLYEIEKNLHRLRTDYVKLIAEVEFLTGTKISE